MARLRTRPGMIWAKRGAGGDLVLAVRRQQSSVSRALRRAKYLLAVVSPQDN